MKKLAILGKLPTKFYAPFDDKNYDIWAFNVHTEPLPRVDVWFDIHTNNPNPNAHIRRNNFPFEDVENLVGGRYYNNTVSYLLAYAILKGYKDIDLYGIRFDIDKERRKLEYQNFRELLFFAKGKGINISAPFDNQIFKEYARYGENG